MNTPTIVVEPINMKQYNSFKFPPLTTKCLNYISEKLDQLHAQSKEAAKSKDEVILLIEAFKYLCHSTNEYTFNVSISIEDIEIQLDFSSCDSDRHIIWKEIDGWEVKVKLDNSNYKQVIDILINTSIIQLKYLKTNDYISIWKYTDGSLVDNKDLATYIDPPILKNYTTALSLANYIYNWYFKSQLIRDDIEPLTLDRLMAMLYIANSMYQLKQGIPLITEKFTPTSTGVSIDSVYIAYHNNLAK